LRASAQRSQETIHASANVVSNRLIMWACRSAYKKVKNGNSVIGPASPFSGGIARLGFQYHWSIG
jgi:hypothetical protein